MTGSPHTVLVDGDDTAVGMLMDAHHRFAVLLAAAVGARPAAVALVERAWVDTVAAALSQAGTPLPGVRASLLDALLRLLREHDQLDGTDPVGEPLTTGSRAGFFLPPDDRWAGWWDTGLPSWPAGQVPTADQVLHAVRRLPPRERTLLILRDAAKLSVTETARIVGVAPEDQGRLLDGAREAYVAHLDEEVRAGDSGDPDGGGRTAGGEQC
ncbi:RNA polymerase sigma factor [Frankia sp. CiP3]|uniref:RNA polymerase sigma factor n=1 Tax=Frankia sp. CiP3 TaxID=2880971 RepID=UPI001EF5CF85|nr:sigma factor-like helix-turn-helix DNA-binding protein [Frankia sp. CiP3]